MCLTNREKLLNINKNSLGDKYSFIYNEDGNYVPVGQGGSGIVYRAKQIFSTDKTVFVDRAIKFFIFRDDLVGRWGYVSNDNFHTEIKNITRFNHQNILKVIDGDYYSIKIGNKIIPIPYTVTEFIEGYNFENLFNDKNKEACQQTLKNEETIFDLFLQIANGIHYLHQNNFYHCDIAPKNIFIKSGQDGSLQAVIGDLGAGRTIKPKTFDNVNIIGTKEYMPDDVKVLKNTAVSYDTFCKLQPNWDIFSTVKTLKNIILNIKKAEFFQFDFWNLDRLYEKLDEHEYNNIKELASDIEHLRPSSNQIFKLDELSEASKNIRQILIPINTAYLSLRMRDLSKHDTLLRLMDVPQLLEGATTFPGANHTRYEHSLGTYELMRKAMLALLRNKTYAKFFSEKNVIIGLLSALLSSLIHFPYSYAITELQNQEETLYRELSQHIVFKELMNIKSEVSNKSLSECIQKHFGEYQINISDLQYVLFGKTDKRNKELDILRLLINSSVGVRVIDYLMRDSHHIGLTYKLEPNDLFKSMSIYKGEFCLRQSGITSAEQIITNRYWLFKRIYWSDPNRANAALLKYLFYKVYSNKFAKELLKIISSASKFDIQKLILKYSKKDKETIEHSIKFINQKGQKRYKSILVLNKNSEYAYANDTCSKFSSMSYSKQNIIREKIETVFLKKYKIPESLINNGVPLLIDMPYEKPNNKLGDDIRILRYDNSYLLLSRASGIVSGMKTAFEDQLMLLRVYIRPDIYEKVIDIDKNNRSEIETFLNEQLHNLL